MVSFSVNPVIILSSVLSLVSIAIAVFSIIKYKELYHHYDMFMRGRDAETLEDFIYNEKEEIMALQDEDRNNKEAIRLMNRSLRASFQKKGIVHYDAFSGMGGKMSFAMALLDYTNTGFVINCMHSREGCFLYVKEVDAGTTDTPLGTEEKEALERALGYIEE
ncbi:MAG: DUF4446 family protein [Candidatus Avilachnospira sp.]|jgi:hypothetical protein